MVKNAHAQTNQSFYDRVSHSYDFLADAGEHRARIMGEDALKLQQGESVLEIGFGTGNSLLNFADQVGAEGSIVGIDVSPRMRAVAEAKLRDSGLTDNVSLKTGDARTLPFGDGLFDAVFMSFTLELFPPEDIPLVLREVARVLKSGGRVGVVSMATVRQGEHTSAMEKTYLWMHQHFPHIVDCRPINVRGVLEQAQFTVTHDDTIDIWTMPVRIVVATQASAT